MARTPKKQLLGFWAKAITTTTTGTLSTQIPAGIFSALPVIGHTVLAVGGTRDHVFTLTGLTLNADKTITVTGFVRRSLVLVVLGDPFQVLPSQVVVHLTAMESD